MKKNLWLLAFCAVCASGLVVAQSSNADGGREPAGSNLAVPPTTPPAVTAHHSETAPVVDGNVLDDPVWSGIPGTKGFWQTTPDEGHPSTEETEVRILYTETTLYFGVICYDRNPRSIINADSRRDSSMNDTDSFQIILDTYLDRQNGFVFGTNPAGIEYDGQVVKEGEGGGGGGPGGPRQQGGSGGGFNVNWDGAWEVRTQIGEFGWSAEFAIPFRTLRYPRSEMHTWGLNFQRNIRRRNETAFWAPLTRQYNLYRLSEAGTLDGMEIPTQRYLQVTPYLLGLVRQRDAGGKKTNWLGEGGLDLKYGLTPSLNLDVTYNTDFAQVEVDEQQINLDRFNLFFPEKRPFFLENSGFFTVGSPGEVDLFFSRRIGIGPRGSAIPILAGARVSGKLSGMNVGFLNMQTDEVQGLATGNNFTVARVSRDLPNRSGIGAIFTNRQGTGQSSLPDDHGRTYGFDGRWGIGEFLNISGFLAKTQTPGLESDQHAYKVGFNYETPAWDFGFNYTEVGDNFNPEVGFLSRGGFRKYEARAFYRYRVNNFFRYLRLHELRPHMNYRGFWNFEGFQETGYVHVDNHWEFKNSAQVHTGMNFTREGVTEPFEISDGVVVPPGTYDHQEAAFVAFTDQSAPFSLNLRTTMGGFFGGDRVALSPSLQWRYGETFNVNVSWNRNDIDLPGGNFVTNLLRTRISYSISPKVFLQSLIQYNDSADNWSMNFRFAWLQAANTGLFVVYNQTRDFGDFAIPDRSLIIKFSRLFNVLN